MAIFSANEIRTFSTRFNALEICIDSHISIKLLKAREKASSRRRAEMYDRPKFDEEVTTHQDR